MDKRRSKPNIRYVNSIFSMFQLREIVQWSIVLGSALKCRVKWGNLELPCKSSVNGKLQVKFSVCNVSVN